MKILIIQDYLRSGGTERQSLLLSGAFAAAGHDTRLLTFRPGGALAPLAGVACPALQPFDMHLDWFAPGLVGRVRLFRPDILLAMGRMANCYSGTLQRRFPRTAVVGTLRTGKPLPWLFRRSLPVVRHIVANSEDAREAIAARHGIDPAKITVIRNPLVFEPEAADLVRNEELRLRHGAGPGTTVLLSVAMFRPEKGQRRLIEIAAGLPHDLDWQLWFAGDGPSRAACQRLAEKQGLQSRVRFLGFQGDPGPLYAAADIAVHASTKESLSNFLIEAQARGLPAVAAEAQGARECMIPGRTGFVVPGEDRVAFRSVLIRLMREPAVTRAARAADARNFARDHFDPARQIGAYLDLFTHLAAAR